MQFNLKSDVQCWVGTECGEVQLVDEYVGMPAQQLCKGKVQVRRPDAISAVALKQCVIDVSFV